MSETEEQMLRRIGTDPGKWTDAFMKIKHERGVPENPNEEWGWMVGWFANAIAAGEIEGYDRAVRRTTQIAGKIVKEAASE